METELCPSIFDIAVIERNNWQMYGSCKPNNTTYKLEKIIDYNDGDLNNLEIKKTNNHHREKVVFKDFKFDNFKLHESLKKIGITNVVDQKIRVKYLRSYYELNGLGRITLDRNIEFFHPNKNYHNSIRINDYVLEVKINDNKFDKNNVEKLINFKESRFSKYCVGINCLYSNSIPSKILPATPFNPRAS